MTDDGKRTALDVAIDECYRVWVDLGRPKLPRSEPTFLQAYAQVWVALAEPDDWMAEIGRGQQ